MRLNNGLFSDNYILIILSIIISFVFIIIKQDSIFKVFFTPTIPILISLFLIDLRMKRLPDYLTNKILLLATFMLLTLIIDFQSTSVINYNLINSLLLFVIYFIIAILTGGALGGGDIKLMGAIGLFFQIRYFSQFLIYPFLIGGIQSLYLVFIKKKNGNQMFAFAPSIIISIFIIAFSW